MELLYLWINRSDYSCIKQQEFNFSPIYKFKVDDLKTPRSLSCEKKGNINIFNSCKVNNKIKNITAVVGSNGAGKTTLLSFIAKNVCSPKFNNGSRYEKNDANDYEHEKSIYVFIEDEKLIVYYNLEEEITCKVDVLPVEIYWNNGENTIKQLSEVRKQLIVYVSNSSFVPESLLGYSKNDETYNVNLHPRSMNLVSSKFYKAIFGKIGLDDIKENDDGFAWVIKKNRDDKKFQELLDIQYYQYLLENRISDFVGNFKCEIYVYFDSIINLIKRQYHDDFKIIKENDDKSKEDKSAKAPSKDTPSELRKTYYEKIAEFEKYCCFTKIKDIRRKNITVVLYVNLLFEVFFSDANFRLPKIDFNESLYEQLKGLLPSDKYEAYLEDIKKIDDILDESPMYKNLIDNPDDLACSYLKVVNKGNTNFYNHIRDMFKERKSFVLRYIRVKNLEMSSGERAMQNMFSRLVLMPDFDEIMGIRKEKEKEKLEYTSKLFLIDEIDLYAHPEWQRKIMDQLISTINKIEKENPVQIVISSHSPFILSDFPRQNTIYMNRRDGGTVVEDSDSHKESFDANIYTLLKEAFFLENGAVGEFAKKKIYEVYKELEEKEPSDNAPKSKENEHQLIIDMIGDEFVRHAMQQSFDRRYRKIPQVIHKEVPQNIDELQKLKKQLENSLDAVNKMLGGG
ncbi:AAA ATPase domain-containing protein [Tindallia magadiensis]|uniref:AAA ATPase domain-containing protein n=1 Tax=Tindallia magadiensis TaxID=69895 RepID=A0A1I3HSX9_9FIRM|nr:AAA family ATPase [Tindallia magadiensis]SFI38761.1 AAA ATPase domain-containing protein [Tindallia magadiensis]